MWVLDLVSRSEIERAVYAAGHSLWIGGIVGILLWLALRVIPARRAGLRYGVALGALGLIVLSHPVAYALLAYGGSADVPNAVMVQRAADPSSPSVSVERTIASVQPPKHIDWIKLAGLVWAMGSGVMLVRMTAAVRGARRLVAGGEDGSDSPAGKALERIMRRVGWQRRIRVLLVTGARSPAVVGVLRPILLVPAAIACDLTPTQLEAILLHELAHIRRYDYLVNLAQMLIEALLFFNPAVWFVSRQIRIEREACCDAFAARATGAPLDYAKALGSVMGRMAAPALAASGQGGRLDRVRRLLSPGHRPVLRLSAPMVLATVAAAVLLFAGVWKTTNTAVAAVADWMSDKDRVEKIAAVQKETQSEEPKEGTATLAGRVVTADGSPLPKIHWGTGKVSNRNSSTVFSFSMERDGAFRLKEVSGKAVIWIVAEGYGPVVWGPELIKPGETRENIQLTLRPGRTGQVVVLDADSNEPVRDSELSVTQILRDGGSTQWIDPKKISTDEKGLLVITGLGDLPVKVEAAVSGYQETSADFDLKSGDKPQLRLRRAKVVSGQVTANGKPVSDARIVKMYQTGTGGGGWYPLSDNAPLLARSDAQGRFALDTLNDGAIYNIANIAKEYSPKLLYEVTSASGGLDVALAPAVHVRGKVLGTPEELQKYLDGGHIHWGQTIRIAPSNSYGSGSDSLTKIAGNEATFDITGFVPGKIEVGTTPHVVEVDATKDVDNLVIDLRPDSPNAAKARTREVQLRIKTPAGAPAAEGTVNVAGYDPAGPMTYRETKERKVVKGVATFASPVGKTISYGTGKLVGYWIERSPFAADILVPEGDGPFVLEAEARPAGAVYGIVLGIDGKPMMNASVSLITVKKADEPTSEFPPSLQPAQTGADGKYLLAPVMLGGTYRIGVSGQSGAVGDQHVVSETFVVTGAKPLAQADARMVKGVDVTGRVVDEAGRPVPAIEIRPSLSTPWSYGFGMSDRHTDEEGRFTVTNLDPDWLGKLSVEVRPARDYAAANVELKIRQGEQSVTLKRGVSFSGRVVDDATGQGVSGVTVRLALDYRSGNAPWVEVRTNDKGEFATSTLQSGTYSIYLDECYSPGTTFEQTASGSYKINGSQSFAPVDPQKEKSREFRVVVAPWHSTR